MKKLLVLLAFGILLLGCTQSGGGAPAGGQPSGGGAGSGGSGGSGTSVTIQGFAFSPADLTVAKGTTVTWTNQDSAPHTVKFGDGTESPTLSKGQSYSRTFSEAGEFSYICGIHPSMTGKVKVS
ncbi:MAG: cupredoxin family copper-binding protein [Candidatus Micrarchaeota archaeon]